MASIRGAAPRPCGPCRATPTIQRGQRVSKGRGTLTLASAGGWRRTEVSGLLERIDFAAGGRTTSAISSMFTDSEVASTALFGSARVRSLLDVGSFIAQSLSPDKRSDHVFIRRPTLRGSPRRNGPRPSQWCRCSTRPHRVIDPDRCSRRGCRDSERVLTQHDQGPQRGSRGTHQHTRCETMVRRCIEGQRRHCHQSSSEAEE